MKIKLALGAKLAPQFLEQIKPFCQVRLVGNQADGDKTGLFEQCMGSEIIYLSSETADRACLTQWKQAGLQLLGCARSNPVNIDTRAAKELDIPLVYCPGRNAQSVAELTIALLLCAARNVHIAWQNLQNGALLADAQPDIYHLASQKDVVWRDDRIFVRDIVPQGTELYEKTLGLVGFGAIGSRVCGLAQAFDMRVLVYDPYCSETRIQQGGATPCTLPELWQQADFVSLHLPVNQTTKGMVNEQWFSAMKPSACLINTSRAALVDQQDLVHALRTGQIAGAAMDVMWKEPCPKNHPLLAMPTFLLTPHIGGWTDGVELWQSRMIADEIIRYAKGEPPLRLWKNG